jgi:hypothetical protein
VSEVGVEAGADDAGAGPGVPDVDPVVDEIVDAARRAREDGRHPPGLDRELDQTYGRLVGHRPGDDRLTQAIWSADAAAHITADAGLGETHGTAKRLVKRVLAKLVRWYILRVTNQVTTFANAATTAMRLLSDRVEALIEEVESARPPVLPGRAPLTTGRAGTPAPSPLVAHPPFADLAVKALSGTAGRVLHADCGSGEMLVRLAEHGADAYGVEPLGALVEAPAAPGLDLVQGEVLAHLRSVPSNGLAGVLLSGCTDRLRTGDARRLAFLLGSRVAPGGTVVLVGTSPAAWDGSASPVELDLAPGRPLHAGTWRHLLAEYGFAGFETVEGPELEGFAGLPEGLRRRFGGPDSYAVTAVRSR